MSNFSHICNVSEACGNCVRLHESMLEQSTGQQAWLKRNLGLSELTWIDSPNPTHYRSRIRLRADKRGQLGYFKSRSHTHVPIPTCAIAHQCINDILTTLPSLPFPAKAVEFRSNGQSVVANILSHKGRRPDRNQIQAWADNHFAGVGLDGNVMLGNCKTILTVCDVEHHLSLNSFYQVNLEINELLVSTLRDWVLEHNPTQVLDLYCGAGNIGAAIAMQGTKVVGMDMAPSSIQDAKQTIKRHDLPMEVHQRDADKFEAGDAFFDVAVLDPPRKGAKGVISELQITRPKAIFYVSCNPRALAADLREAKQHGYTVHRATAFDMFPQTHHVETLIELRRT